MRTIAVMVGILLTTAPAVSICPKTAADFRLIRSKWTPTATDGQTEVAADVRSIREMGNYRGAWIRSGDETSTSAEFVIFDCLRPFVDRPYAIPGEPSTLAIEKDSALWITAEKICSGDLKKRP